MNLWLPGHIAIFKMDDQQGPTICSTWNSAQCYVAAWLRGEFRGEWMQCICMAESLGCLPETVTILLIGYTPIQN